MPFSKRKPFTRQAHHAAFAIDFCRNRQISEFRMESARDNTSLVPRKCSIRCRARPPEQGVKK